MICDIRMDERLIHGQSMSAWIPYFGATHVIVVAKDIINDEFQKSVLKMAASGNYKLLITDGVGATDIIKDPRSEKFKMFIVCKTPEDVFDFVKNIELSKISRVNLAAYGRLEKVNMPNRKVLVKGQLIVDDMDLDFLKKIELTGVKCVIQVMPEMSESKISFQN